MKIHGVSQVIGNMNAWSESVKANAAMGMGAAIGEAESYAKSNAPWTDRTGNARASIQGTGPTIEKTRIRAALAIGVYYGVFLELCNGGKYRIVWPAVMAMGAKLPGYLKGR